MNKYTVFVLLFTLSFFISPSINAQKVLRKKSKNNYIHLKTDFQQQINKLSANKVIFLYVHSDRCGYCKIVAPVVEQLTKKYPKALFVKVDIENARDFLKKRYKIIGTPNIMLVYKGNIASAQYHFANSTREESVNKWAEQVYPTLKNLAKHKNIDCITAFNYMTLMADKQYIMYRGNARLGQEYEKNINLIFQLAKKYPNYYFGITSGQIPYGQEVDTKYAKVYRRFSIINNIDNIQAKLEPYGASNHKLSDVSQWIEGNVKP